MMETPQLILALAFLAVVALFLVWKRRQVAVEWLVFPVLYFAMYRSSWGLRAMDRLASRFPRLLAWLGRAFVGLGFVGMGLIAFHLVTNLVAVLTSTPGASTVGIVQPFAQNVPGTIFVPFVYFIASIFIIAVLHEFSHGVMSRVHKCRVRSSGFAFLGVLAPLIPAAFVEPDEQDMQHRPASEQLSILAAGPASNLLAAGVLLVLLVYLVTPVTASLITPLGVEVVFVSKESPAEAAGLKPGELITAVNDKQVKDSRDLLEALNQYKPGDAVSVITNISAHAVMLAGKPSKPEQPYFGVQVTNRFIVAQAVLERFGSVLPNAVLWFAGLLYWVFNLSLGIGLFNLVPLGPIDGGKMLKIGLSSWFDQQVAHRIWMVVSFSFLAAILINVGAAFFV